MTDQKPNKRKFDRINTLNLVSLEQLDGWGNVAMILMGRTLDLSVGGIKLEITEPVPFLSDIQFQIGLHEDILRAKGKVVFLRQTEDKKIHCGVDFTDLSPKDRRLIEQFLEEKK
jgi:c-di-GMP-binding flagellar brake protein YcgR